MGKREERLGKTGGDEGLLVTPYEGCLGLQ